MMIKKIEKKLFNKANKLYPNKITKKQYEKIVASFPVIPKDIQYDK